MHKGSIGNGNFANGSFSISGEAGPASQHSGRPFTNLSQTRRRLGTRGAISDLGSVDHLPD